MIARRRPSSFAAGLVAIVALGVGLRIAYLALDARPLPDPGDAVAYHLLADGLASGDGYVRPFDRIAGRILPTAEWAPAFPALLAVGDLVGLDDLDEQRAAAAAIAGFGIALTGIAGLRVAGPSVGLLAAGLIAFHPLVVQNDTALLTEGLAAAAGAAVLVASLRLASSASAVDAAIAGGLVGAAALVRADALALVPLLLLPMCVVAGRAAGRGPRAARLFAVAATSVSLVVAPWVVRNSVRLDRFVGISTNAGTAVAGSHCDVTYHGDVVGYWRFGPGCFGGYDTAELVERGEAAVAADHLEDGLEYAGAHASRVPTVVGARVLRLWGLWDVDEQASLAALDEGKSSSWVRSGTWVGWAVLLAAAIGLAMAARRGAWGVVVAAGAPLLAVTVAAAITYGNARFRAGAEPALAVMAAFAALRSWGSA